ncbi:hypothetical protein JXA05_02490 [Candidatus Peregrinibacteria bacterium]|nr:hypothetical protein [Candidatus Peregrinibacteria bacterium]
MDDQNQQDYQFDDINPNDPAPPVLTNRPARSGQRPGSYPDEIFSKRIDAKFRTFFVDLKESANGKFVKISEKSHGKKSTIMMDKEDIPMFIEALQEIQTHL